MSSNALNPTTSIQTGNPELDMKMGGGLPRASLTLIEGTSGAGKSVLTQQIMSGALHSGLSCTLFTSENTVKSLMVQMQSIDMNVLDYLLLRRLRVYPIALMRLGKNAPDMLLRAMHNEIKRDLLIVDSFTSAISHGVNGSRTLGFFETCKRLAGEGVTIIVTLHAGAIGNDFMSPIRSMCDANLVLRSSQDGQRLIKTLEVVKIRGASSSTGSIVGFEVEPGWGMRVIPISKARG
ncbi:MAG: flagellar accessory protein FlaH [Anaerolinea sp.]|nr:flagellar accessory protein FlaH [Anaerolinea sp.]